MLVNTLTILIEDMNVYINLQWNRDWNKMPIQVQIIMIFDCFHGARIRQQNYVALDVRDVYSNEIVIL